MKKSNALYAVIFLLVLLSCCLAIWVYYLKEGKDLLNFTISMVGFCIALLALFIAVRTYTSIDSVNNITKMDGNILDNERYVVSLPELIDKFRSKNEIQLEGELFESIELRLKKYSNTAVLFAETLQYLIDVIVIFPAIFNAVNTDKEYYKKRMDRILTMIDKKRDSLHSVSRGNSIQITESIKLFKAVVAYQKFVADNNFNVHASLLHVRGPILRNSVTRTIYHNYLGLYYNKKGMHLLRESLCTASVDILSVAGLALVGSKVKWLLPSVKADVLMYLWFACDHFDKALEISTEDLMWPGFINYNKSRTLYFINMISDSTENWVDAMDAAILYRSRLNVLIDEVLTENRSDTPKVINTHLKHFFTHQEELARLVKLNLIISDRARGIKKHSMLYRGANIDNLQKQQLVELFVNCDSFTKIESYQKDVIQALF